MIIIIGSEKYTSFILEKESFENCSIFILSGVGECKYVQTFKTYFFHYPKFKIGNDWISEKNKWLSWKTQNLFFSFLLDAPELPPNQTQIQYVVGICSDCNATFLYLICIHKAHSDKSWINKPNLTLGWLADYCSCPYVVCMYVPPSLLLTQNMAWEMYISQSLSQWKVVNQSTDI